MSEQAGTFMFRVEMSQPKDQNAISPTATYRIVARDPAVH